MNRPLIAILVLLVPWTVTHADARSDAARECRALHEAKNYDKAFAACNRAAKVGDVESQYLLGRQYEKAQGTPRDLEAALRLYRGAADKGHAPSQRRVAAAYAWGVGGVDKDEAEALKWLKRAAEGGDTRAQKQLAEGYRRGVGGLPKDEKLAREWDERAARGGKSN